MEDELEDYPDPSADLDELASRVEELENRSRSGYAGVSAGYAIGSALATVLSWNAFHAVLWAALAGFFSWFYVIYYVIAHWGGIKLI